MFYPLNAPNLKCLQKCQYAAASLVSGRYVKDPAGFSPKCCCVARCPTILSECPAEKIIKVIKEHMTRNQFFDFQKDRCKKHTSAKFE